MSLITEYGIKPHTERIPGYVYSLSYGGGLNSTAMLIEVVRRKMPLDYVVFADPGFERKGTYDFIERHFMRWILKHNIRFVYVSRYVKGERETILQFWQKNHRVPDIVYRDCTTKNKIIPIHKFYKKQIMAEKVIEYMGIHYGEGQRIKKSATDWITKCYPLYDFRIDKRGCEKIIEDEGLPIPEKSGCPNCFAHNKAAYFKLFRDDPAVFDKAIEIEENYVAYKLKQNKKPYYYMLFHNKPTRLLDLKKEFQSMSTLDEFPAEEQSNDASCIEGCMT